MAMKYKNLMDKRLLQGPPHIFVWTKKPLDRFNLEKLSLHGTAYTNSQEAGLIHGIWN